MADIFGFLVGRAIAEREGVDRERANQLGLVPAIMGSTGQSLLLTYVIARKEAEESERVSQRQTPSGDTELSRDVSPPEWQTSEQTKK